MGNIIKNNEFTPEIKLLAPAKPVLQISKLALRSKVNLFLDSFPGETSYAVKANPHEEIIAEFIKAGMNTFDVASTEEMQLVHSVSPTANLHYHNPIRSLEETKIALHVYDCDRFSVDHKDALFQILDNISNPQEIEIAIRFRMENENKAIQNFQSKFGVAEDEAITLANMARDMGFVVGLTFHPGSQTNTPDPYIDHLKIAHAIHKKVSGGIAFLNVGGGFPSSYKGLQTSPLGDYFSAIKSTSDALFGQDSIKLECEPGRALVAGAGTLVTTVKNARPERGELYLNDGIYGGLMEFNQFPTLEPEYSTVTDANCDEAIDWIVYGPTCDPADVLPVKLNMPANLKEGDLVKFHGVGAYSTATSTNFNGYGTIEVQMT